MSGRKSSEVAAVLKQGESVRAYTDGIYREEIQRRYKEYLKSQSTEQELKSTASGEKVELEAEAAEMFGEEGRALAGELGELEKKMSEPPIRDEGAGIIAELEKLDEERKGADEESAAIREAIRHKNWYCDEEYRRAEELVERYGKLRDERVELERRMKKLLTAEKEKVTELQAKATRLKNLTQQLKNMNTTAKKRKAAETYRGELRGEIETVEAEWAEKFYAAEFEELRKSISATVALNDEGVLNAFQKVYAAVVNFKKKLSERIARYHQEKSDAENLYAQLEGASEATLIGPIDYYKKNGKRVNPFEYLKTYGGLELSGEFDRLRAEAAAQIRNENFTESMKITQRAIELAEDARQKGLELQESMLKKAGLAVAIQRVMSEMNYDVAVQILNNNPNDGFKITCSVGDEIIDFRRVDIDGDGKVVIDIEHKEGRGGNCANSWKKISRQLNEKGVPVTDVRTAKGSVLHSAATATTAAQGTLKVQH